ncbi:MAG: 4-hydroxythreonine-4-phosphate dehydrogenase PdxA, partial [Paraburkholderia sp.]|uniref:4-hydroxythreonine-4-phosphate dehydrogenase PdxA n=1 Tax=Paraburkholderia sp. TaxID=1926495 RepID=UPI003C342E52
MHEGIASALARLDPRHVERAARAAARTLRNEGIAVIGPQGADLLLTNPDVDVFVAMYHDQGHIP